MDLFSHRGPARARAWRWCVQLTFGGPPEGRRQRGGLPEPAALAGLRTKPGVVAPTAPRAELHPAADHHGPERLSPRLIPTSMKTARPGRQQALCPGPSRDSCSQSPLPLFVPGPRHPRHPPHLSCPLALASSAPGRTKQGDTPALGEGSINPGGLPEGGA